MVDEQGSGDGAVSPEDLVRQVRSVMQMATTTVIASGIHDPGSGTAAISAHDPGFDQTNFLAWVRQVHFAVVTAWTSGQPQGVRPYVGDNLYPRLSADISQASTAGRSALPDVLDEDKAVIRQSHSDASVDTIKVHLNSHAALPEGSSGKAVWTFQRSAQAITPPGGVNTGAAKSCPSCGAPLKLDPDGECAYCRAPFRASSSDWLLIDIAPEQNTSWNGQITTPVVSRGGRSLVGAIIAIGIAIGVIGAIVGVVAATKGGSAARSANAQANDTVNSIVSAVNSQVSNAFANLPTVPATPAPTTAPTTPPPPSIAARLTLSGAINLSPSDLDAAGLVLNGHTGGGCLPAGEPLHAIAFNVIFDSGASMKGQFATSQAIGRGASSDLANGGAALLHFVGPTQASADDETWPMPAGQPGLVTITTDASGGGTLKWQSLQSSEPASNYAGPSSGLVTWTC